MLHCVMEVLSVRLHCKSRSEDLAKQQIMKVIMNAEEAGILTLGFSRHAEEKHQILEGRKAHHG